jgi:small-conductance mechanosensitive channel
VNTIASNVLDSIIEQVEALVSNGLARLFGPRINEPAIGFVTWTDLGIIAVIVTIILLVHGATALYLKYKRRHAAAKPETRSWHPHLLNAIGKPLYLLIWMSGIYVAVAPLLTKHTSGDEQSRLRELANRLFDFSVFVILFWAFFRLTRALDATLITWAKKTETKIDDVIAPLLGRALRVLVPVIGIIFALPLIGLPPKYSVVIARGSSILIICSAAWIISQAVNIGEKALLARYDVSSAGSLRARRLYMQVHVLSRTLYFFIVAFTIASILMLIPEVRHVGASLLASAGIAGIVAGLAAQRTIANLFAGFQLAMTQPIRLDDVVALENEWGRIEEITLTYVVVNLWDERRLILPLSYFIEKPFQNWTRISSELLGPVILTVTVSESVDELRKAARQIVESSPLWDKRFWNLQVTDLTFNTIQLRVLASAANPQKAWDLRCEIREKLVAYLQKRPK